MMKHKKKLAILLAGAMVMAAPTAAFASGNVTGTAIGGGGSIGGGSGDLGAWVEKNVFNATIPTSLGLGFRIDPQGLLGTVSGGSVEQAEGKVHFTNTDEVVVTNHGSLPFAISATVKVTGASGAATDVTMLASSGAVNADKNTNLYIALTPAQTFTTDASGNSIVATSATNSIPVDTAGTTLTYALDKTLHEVVDKTPLDTTDYDYDYSPVVGATDDSIGFKLSGLVNKNADWSAYAPGAVNRKTLELSATYELNALDGTYDELKADTAAWSDDTTAHGLLKGSGSATSGVTQFTFKRGVTNVDPTFDVPLPSGASNTIAPTISIVGTGSNNSAKTPPAGGPIWTYNAATGKVVFLKTSPALSNVTTGWAPDTYTCTLTFNNNVTSTIKLTIQ